MASYPNELFSAFAFLGFLCVTIPLPWHLQAWNTGTCLYMIWTALGCLNLFVNSVVWNGNAINWAPVWCDISSRIIIALSYAIPAASLVINRRLYHISAVTTVTVTEKEKRRAMFVDLGLGVGIPVFGILLHYINEGHRFDIYEDIGCFPPVYNSVVYYATMVLFSYVIALSSAVYCVLSIKAFNTRRVQFNALLASQSTSITSSRYFRLMSLAGLELLINLPFLIYTTIVNVNQGLSPWTSWSETHFGFSRIDQFPALLWRNAPGGVVASVETQRWAVVGCAVLFFAFFGFAEEARRNYRSAFESVSRKVGGGRVGGGSFGRLGDGFGKVKGRLGLKGKMNMGTIASFGAGFSSYASHPNGARAGNGSSSDLPIFVTQETRQKHDTIVSLALSDVSFADAGGALADLESKQPGAAVPAPASTRNPTLAVAANAPSSTLTSLSPPVPTDSDARQQGDMPSRSLSKSSTHSRSFWKPFSRSNTMRTTHSTRSSNRNTTINGNTTMMSTTTTTTTSAGDRTSAITVPVVIYTPSNPSPLTGTGCASPSFEAFPLPPGLSVAPRARINGENGEKGPREKSLPRVPLDFLELDEMEFADCDALTVGDTHTLVGSSRRTSRHSATSGSGRGRKSGDAGDMV